MLSKRYEHSQLTVALGYIAREDLEIIYIHVIEYK